MRLLRSVAALVRARVALARNKVLWRTPEQNYRRWLDRKGSGRS